jgi:hypothetical protein
MHLRCHIHKVDADSQWLLAPLVVLLAHQARTAAPDAKAHYERRNLYVTVAVPLCFF